MKVKDENALNKPEIPRQWTRSIVVGLDQISLFINKLVKQSIASCGTNCSLAFEGVLGVEWKAIVPTLERSLNDAGFDTEILDISLFYRASHEIEGIINPILNFDPFFGRVFNGNLDDLLDLNLVQELKRKLKNQTTANRKHIGSRPKATICFGCGAANKALRPLYSFIFYVDLTREEFTRRSQKNGFGFLRQKDTSHSVDGVADVGLPVYLFKLTNYVYYPVLERHKKYLLPYVDFYVDGNITEKPKLISREIFSGLLSILGQYPVRLKPVYIPSPWGGQWIKKTRRLPTSVVNCAWSFEAIAPEMSLKVAVGSTFLEIPFLTFLLKESRKIMGDSAVRRFGNFFPIRVHYDDSMEGGNMAIQVHPPTSYVKTHFNEKIGQDESYYVVLAGRGAKVYLGLKERIDKEEFCEAVRKAEIQRVSFDYDKYVNSIPSKAGDLFLIPAGTVHASGRNQLVLEIGNSYGYTFHIYDYLRPDLHGRLRPIHSGHALQVIRFHRTARWVNRYLKQRPRLIRSGQDWAEYLLGRLREIPYVVHRLEFATRIGDDTKGRFHILTLVEGDSIIIKSKKRPERRFDLGFSETVIVPACFGKYSIRSSGQSSCKVLKVLLK